MKVTKTIVLDDRDLCSARNADSYVLMLSKKAGGRIISFVGLERWSGGINTREFSVEVDVPVRKGRVMKPYPFR